MPTYTYHCDACGDFEHQAPITDPALGACPTCGGPVERIITPGAGFIIKGQGATRSNCGHETPCCGRAQRCDEPPCGK